MPDLIARDNAAQLLKNAPEQQQDNFSFAQRLSLEANLLGGGVKDGFMDRLQQARENPGITALEFGAAAAIGAGLTAMHQAGGRWGVAANIAGTGLKWVAIGDVVRRGAPTAYAMVDTMINPKNYAENRAIVASNLGGALFDYPLMMAGGMLGSKAVSFGPRAISNLSDRFSNKAPVEGLPKNLEIPPDALKKFGNIPPETINAATPKPTPGWKALNEAARPATFGDLPANSNPGIRGELPTNNPVKFEIPGKTIKPFEINPDLLRINTPKFNFGDITSKAITVRSTWTPIIPLPIYEQEIVLKKLEKK